MPTRLFHLLARTAGERVRIVDGDGPRAFPEMVIYSPPNWWMWDPERHLFRPKRGDVLEVSETYEAIGERWYKVPYIDESDLRINVCPGIPASSTIVVTATTANEEALVIMRLRMHDWLDDRNEWAQRHGITSDYSHTSMAAGVAPWLINDLGQALALCGRAGWPEPAPISW